MSRNQIMYVYHFYHHKVRKEGRKQRKKVTKGIVEKVKTEKSIGFRKEEKHESNNDIKCSKKDR